MKHTSEAHNMAADIPFLEVTGRKDVQNGGRSTSKNNRGFSISSPIFVGKIHFFLLFAKLYLQFSVFVKI